jgi:hypothetical protein
MKDKANSIAQIVMLAILLSVAYFGISDNDSMQSYLYKLAIGLGIAICISMIVWIIKNGRLVMIFLRTNFPFTFFRPIRITMAYLFRIELDGQYLLIRNNRAIEGFQPVGGVYKYLKYENSELFDKQGLIPDTKISRDKIGENDLRLQMKRRCKLIWFINWFAKKKNREVDPWREFYEELLNTGVLTLDNFPHIQYRFVRQHRELKYSKHHKILEYRVADIYELQFTSEKQKDEIRRLMEAGHNDVLFATNEDISKGEKDNFKITEHTYKII